MSHLVGGLRDLEVMTIDTETLLYPRIGYLDCMFNRKEKSNSTVQFNHFENKYIIRDQEILSILNTDHSLDKIANKIIDPENALIQIMVDYQRGMPNTDDKILAPKSLNLISKFMNDENNDENLLIKDDDDHEIIGIIEYGCFSMRMAHSRAIGIISLESLKKLWMINQNRKQQLYTLVRTKFNHLRLFLYFNFL
ncbi:ribonucleases P/MRP protein subunit POP1-like protein [Euroglyphus maynei]|uniref:Ribonucleases P/MRP protein subunit POP1-like protein n=1 Tax=Euroglyphus maynei TaxID=6958 RepID=A0A1Y3AS50_EURMA|nr:ribonucleases P/MRP protein subunit POP1-like protein [Euroglyphus maynei]